MSKENTKLKVPQPLIDRKKILDNELKRLQDAMDQVNARKDELTAGILLMNDIDLQKHQVLGFSTDGSEIIIQKIEENGKAEESGKPAGKKSGK